MSYDLRVVGDGDLDLALARTLLADAEDGGDELLWSRGPVSAEFLLTRTEIDVGVTGDEAAAADRARAFESLLGRVLELAVRLGARVHDPQLGRDVTAEDVDAAVREFA